MNHLLVALDIYLTSFDVFFDFHTCPFLFRVDVERRRVLGAEAGRRSATYTGENERGNCWRGGNIFFCVGMFGPGGNCEAASYRPGDRRPQQQDLSSAELPGLLEGRGALDDISIHDEHRQESLLANSPATLHESSRCPQARTKRCSIRGLAQVD